jgi:hypothetical protein
MIRKVRLRSRVFLVTFDSQYKLASTFLRFQEFYESRYFRGKAFSLEEYMDWYADKHGNFTYYQDWDGFNIPSEALGPFYAGRFDPLSQKEKNLLDLFRSESGKFYVIGLVSSNGVFKTDLKHELAHALFAVDASYRKAVLAALARHGTKALESWLFELGYSRAVLRDEVHAWVLSQFPDIPAKLKRGLRSMRRELESIYKRHSA